MASFSVNRDKIEFASQRTGSVTLVFDNFPLSGYRRSISGESSYFTLSTVNTDSQATLTTRAVNNDYHSHRMVVRYSNASDSSDYIEIEVIQRGTRHPQFGGVDYPDIADSEGCWGRVLYVPASEMGGTEVLVDSSTDCSFQIVSDDQSWLNCVNAYPHITDTGFLAYNVTYIRNYDRPARRGTVSFIDTNSNTIDLLVYQEGNTPSQNTVSGYRRVIGECTGAVSADIRIDYPSGGTAPNKYEIINPEGSGQYYDWVTVGNTTVSTYVLANVSTGTGTLNGWNLRPDTRAIIVEFRTTTNANSYVTSVLIVQKGWPDWFDVRPDSICINNQGIGTYGVAVFSDSSATGVITSGSNWLSNLNITSASRGSKTYYHMGVAIAANSTGVDRTGEIQVTDGTDTIAVPVVQSSLSKGAIPSELFFDNDGGDKELEVVTNSRRLFTNVSAHSYPSWLSETVNYYDYDRARFIYTAESNTSSTRTGNIVFADASGNQVTVPVTQGEYVLSVSPSYLSFTSDAGGRLVNVTYASNLSTNGSSMPAWVDESYVNIDTNHREYDIRVSQNNTGSSRSFNWVLTDSTDSITVPITQAAGTPPVQNITVSPSSLIYTYGSSSQNVTLNYISGSYNYSISDGGSSWITINSTAVSSGVDTLSISVSQNTGSQRSATITITSSAGYGSCTVSIIQQEEFYIFPDSGYYTAGGRNESGNYTSLFNPANPVTVSTSDSWISASVSDDRVNISLAENITSGTDPERTGSVVITDALGTSVTYGITQAGDDIMFNPNPVTLDADGSVTVEVYVYAHSSVYASDIPHPDASTVPSWLSINSAGYAGIVGMFYFNVSASENTSSSPRSAVVTFTEMDGAYSGYLYINQEAGEGEELSVSPSELNFSSTGGTNSVTVSGGTGTITVNTSSFPSWLSIASVGGGVYNITASENNGSLRSFSVSFTDEDSNTVMVDVYQQASSVVLTVSPSSKIFGSAGGSQVFRVTYNTSINYNTLPSWLSVVSSTVSASSIEYTMTAEANTGSLRSFSWVLSDAVNSVTVSIVQYESVSPDDPGSLKAYPKKLRYYSEGGGILVSFTNRPTAGIGYTITYIDGSGWLSVENDGPDKYVSATANNGTRRRAEIRFYDLSDNTNYVIVPVIQGSINGYNSIWMDDLFYPEDRDENGLYYYRVVDHNSNQEYFRGVSAKPTSWAGNIGGIDIPRLVDNYLGSFINDRGAAEWIDMNESYCTVDIYNMTEDGYPGVVDETFKYWNDWSRFEKKYDYTRSLNDPINGRGCDNMFMPFCVYYDDTATFSIVDTEKNGNVNTYTLPTPTAPFMMQYDSYYDTKKLEYMQDDEVIFSYDMDHCGPGAFIYRNRFGGWDSFLIEGNIIKTDNYTKLNWRRKGEYNQRHPINTYKYIDEKVTDSVDIDTTYEAYTGWLTDEESERLVFHLLSSPIVYFQNLHKENQLFDTDPLFGLMPIRITGSSAEYKKFRNGKRMVNYLITFEKGNIEKVRN